MVLNGCVLHHKCSILCSRDSYRPHASRRASLRAQAQPGGRDRRDVAMPNGVTWLSNSHNYDVFCYGQNFVVQRPPVGGPGLVLSHQITQLQIVQENQTTNLRVFEEVDAAYDLEAGDYSVSVPLPRLLPGPSVPLCKALGIIYHPTANQASEQAEQLQSGNPRRTRKVQFTCQRCATTTTRPINPKAFVSGTVFAQCAGCKVIHKLTDHLNLVHELSGPVFSGIPAGFQMPPGLPAKPGMTHHTHPAIWQLEDPAERESEL